MKIEKAMKFVELQPRDRELLVGLWRFGVLLRDHIQNLYFPACARRRVNRRLARLTDAGLLIGSQIPLGAFPLTMSEVLPYPGQFAYQLTTAGVSIVAEHLGKDVDETRRRIRYSPSYIAHAVGIASVAVALANHAEAQGYITESFLCESETWHAFQWRESGGPWKSTTIRPDAAAVLAYPESKLAHPRGKQTLLIEADMATQGKRALLDKLQGYKLYQRTGAYARRYSSPLMVVILTTTLPRLKALVSLLEQEEVTFAYCSTFSLLNAQGIDAPIWENIVNPGHAIPLGHTIFSGHAMSPGKELP